MALKQHKNVHLKINTCRMFSSMEHKSKKNKTKKKNNTFIESRVFYTFIESTSQHVLINFSFGFMKEKNNHVLFHRHESEWITTVICKMFLCIYNIVLCSGGFFSLFFRSCLLPCLGCRGFLLVHFHIKNTLDWSM